MRTVDPSKLASAARELGDAVLDPGVWTRIIEQISDAAGGGGAILLQSDVRTPDVPRTESVEALVQAYFAEGWHLRDLRAARCVPRVLGGSRVVIDQDIFKLEEMRSLPMYNEGIFPYGFHWFAAVGFFAGAALWGLSIQRGIRDEPFSPAEARQLAPLSERLTEAATLSTAVGRVALSSAAQALDRIGQPVVAIDRDGTVIETNRGSNNIFGTDLYIDRYGRLCVRDAQASAALQRLFDQLRATSDTTPLAAWPIVVRRQNGAPTIVIRALSIPGAARGPFGGARALLTLSPIEPKPGPDTELIADMFGLTRAEAAVAAMVVQGKSLAAIADARGSARVTVRNQMRTILAKTGTHRQGELVALLSHL